MKFYNIFFENQIFNPKRIFLQKKKQFLFLNFKKTNFKFLKTVTKLNFLIKRLHLTRVKYVSNPLVTNNTRVLANRINWLFLLQQKKNILNKFISSKIFNKKYFFQKTNTFLNFSSIFLLKVANILITLNFILNIKTYLRFFNNKITLLCGKIINTNYSLKLFDTIFIHFDILLLKKLYNLCTLHYNNKKKPFFNKQTTINRIFLKNFEINFLNFSLTQLSINNYIYYSGIILNNIRFLNWRTYNWIN